MNHPTTSNGQRHLTRSTSGRPLTEPVTLGRYFAATVLCLLGVVLVSGCSSTRISDREVLVKEKLPRPNQILVYDFAATAADVPADSTLAKKYSVDAPPQTAEQIATGRRLGAQIAAQLVEEIRDMGMPGRHAAKETTPGINDIVLRGYLVSINEGSAAKRVTIGFGSGSSAMKTAVEGFQMTAQGLRKVGSGAVEAGGSGKSPGGAVGAATMVATANPVGLIVSSAVKVSGEVTGSSKIEGRVKQTVEEIADVLRQRFQEEGWID